MPGDLLLGLDLGTSSVKALLVKADGRVLSLKSAAYPIDSPSPGWAEQDPGAWYRQTAQCIRAVLAESGARPEDVAGVGLSGQMHGLVCLGQNYEPLRPAVIWADSRSTAQVEQVKRLLGTERLGQLTGNPLAAGFLLPSWLWLQENEFETMRETRVLLLPKDYLRFCLTGEIGSEPSDASSTSLFSPAERRWSRELLDLLQVPPDLLPTLGESAQVAGEVSPAAAALTGLKLGTPVVYGGSDQSCQAVGQGVITPGLVSSTIGTGGQILAPTRSPVYDPQLRLHLFCHALPDAWHYQAAILAAGLSLKWLQSTFFSGTSYSELASLASSAPPGAEGLLFTPYLLGERTPHMDPHVRCSLAGLTLRHGREHVVRAVMEGVVFAMRQGLELILELGAPVKQLVASGGAVRHPLWLQLQADIYNRPVYRTGVLEAAALGAALLAGVGTGIYADIEQASRTAAPSSGDVVEPLPENAARYADLYPRFCELYPRLSGFW
jgi:xylulokinase